jgi:hypothetical protein
VADCERGEFNTMELLVELREKIKGSEKIKGQALKREKS